VKVEEPDQSPASIRLIGGLYRRRWARPALSTLARADHPYRQADLITELVASARSMVHFRAFAYALSYLVDNRLVVRHDRPGLVAYEITDLGRQVQARLQGLERTFPQTDHAATCPGGDHG
jgi:hypothetical protein